MNLSRRKMLAIIGGGTILAATVGIGGFLSTRTPHKALEPWNLAGSYAEPRRRALSYAILAPNPHNRQPWMVDLSEPDKITLYVDTNKMLPHTDPFNRQITIGLGCFLELLRMAAAEDGYLATIEGFPSGFSQDKLDKRPVAIISFKPDQDVQKDPLFAHALSRQTLKEPYNTELKIPDTEMAKFTSDVPGLTVGASNDEADINYLRKLTHDALQIEIDTPRTYKESVDLFRIGKDEINKNPDGIDFGGPLFDSLGSTGIFSRETALDVTSSTYSQGIAAIMANVDSAMGYVWIITDKNSRLDQLDVGRQWLRTNLTATANGIATQPLSQVLQEYPEMAEKFQDIHNYLQASGKVVQMIARLGYATPVAQGPRWPIDAKII
ncbi:MAG: twin-arginine translocation pathway signal protein [Hyphomicrobiales bacterium]